MATHQFPPRDKLRVPKDQANSLDFGENDHDLARHTLAWCAIEEGKVPTELLDQLLKTTRTSKGIPYQANLGWMLTQCQRSHEAINRLYKDLDDEPDSVELNLFAAISLQRAKDFRTSKMILERLVESSPRNYVAREYLAEALLNLGQWREGFREKEIARSELTPLQQDYFKDVNRMWTGQPLRGRNLVVVGNDRVSDQVQFSRFIVQLLAQEPHMVGISCSPDLVELMRSLPGVNRVDDKRFEPYDYFVPVENLPLLLGSTPAALPSAAVLRCNARKAREQAAHLRREKPLFGICWRDFETHGCSEAELSYGSRANTPGLEKLSPWLEELSDSYDLIAIQPGILPEEAQILASLGVRCPAPEVFEDYEKVAELLTCLDDLVTVDSPIAHLAGALGLHARVLLPYVSGWKWSVAKGKSQWYPDLDVYEKQSENCWDKCLSEMFADVEKPVALQAVS
ncbi:MAG: hypothetical protein P1V20_26160 [Verrucomicrobiales bacterium]|nr:hypothetical protein [Verrucomicrobiales bacterium]